MPDTLPGNWYQVLGVYTALLPPPWRAHPGARGTTPAIVEYVGTP